MPGFIFPNTIINTENIVPIDFINPQAKEMTNNLRPEPIINTRRVAPVDFTNQQIPNFKQSVNEYLHNFLEQRIINREFVARNNKLGAGSSSSIDLYTNTNNLPFGFFPPQSSNFFPPNTAVQTNQNSLVYAPIPQENLFPNTFVNFDNRGLWNNNVVQQSNKIIEKSQNEMNFAFLPPALSSYMMNEKPDKSKNIVYYRKKDRKEKQLDEFFYKYGDDVVQADSCIIKTKIERQAYAICKTYDQTGDIDRFFCSLTNLPLLSIIRSQRWIINKILDIFESANSEAHASLFLKIFPKKTYSNYNVFGYIAKLCNYKMIIRAYNLHTPIIFEQQNGTDIVSALQLDNFMGKKTKLFILNQIYKEALEYQKKGEIPAKIELVSKNDIKKWL